MRCWFEIDEAVLSEDAEAPLPYAARGRLVETYFIAPVFLRVDDDELLQRRARDPADILLPSNVVMLRRPHQVEIPVLHFATRAHAAVAKLATAHSAAYEAMGQTMLEFTRDDMTLVTIRSAIAATIVSAPYAALSDAIDEFVRQAKTLARERIRWLSEFPDWSEWLKGE